MSQSAPNHIRDILISMIQLASDPNSAATRRDEVDRAVRAMQPGEAARTFAMALFLESVAQALFEQHWLLTHGQKDQQPAFTAFLQTASARELAPLAFLLPLCKDATPDVLRTISTAAKRLTKTLGGVIAKLPNADFREFVNHAVRAMAELAGFEEGLQEARDQADSLLQRRLSLMGSDAQWPKTRPLPEEGYLPASLYRAFDAMDDVFQLLYSRDIGMTSDPRINERLYEGAGVGVQTSYATILTALDHLHLPYQAHLIDLGSGYGRVGLVAGLWREDLRFTGYEFVAHRVEISSASAERAGLSNRVRFVQQDLSDPEFVIPEADAYYMYDPFCEETYLRVLRRLKSIGRERQVTVVTKSGACKWFLKAVESGGWMPPERYDGGTLLLFRSCAWARRI